MTFDLVVNYSRAAYRFLEKNSAQITRQELNELLVKAVKRINGIDINVDIKELKGSKQKHYRLRKGKIRIIFTYEKGVFQIINIEDIGFRCDIY